MTKQERAARTRGDLIRSAAIIFKQHGFASTTLSDICRHAGVSSGALHFHFDNKSAVAQAIELSAVHALRRTTLAAQRDTKNALQAIADVSHALARLLLQDDVVRAGYQLNCEIGRHTEVNLSDEWYRCVQRLLDRAGREGLLAPNIAQRAVVTTIVAATTGLERLSRLNEDWLSRYTLTSFWQLMLPRLVTPETLGSLAAAGTPSLDTLVPVAPLAPSGIAPSSPGPPEPGVRDPSPR